MENNGIYQFWLDNLLGILIASSCINVVRGAIIGGISLSRTPGVIIDIVVYAFGGAVVGYFLSAFAMIAASMGVWAWRRADRMPGAVTMRPIYFAIMFSLCILAIDLVVLQGAIISLIFSTDYPLGGRNPDYYD